MSEQRPTDRAVSDCQLDGEPLQPTFHEMGDGSTGAAHAHFALLYETPDELFTAVLPFIREGLDRGEHCMYIADDTTHAAVTAAMETAGIDVEAARAAGALSLHTKEAYVEDGAFDPDAMIDFLDQRMDEVTDEEDCEGVRIAGEMT